MKRYLTTFIVFIALFGFLCVRLCYLASGIGIVSDGNYTRKIDIASRRGFIYDRNFVPIAGIANGYITVVDPIRLSAADDDYIKKLAESGGNSFPQIVEKMGETIPFKLYTSVHYDDEYAYSVPIYDRNAADYTPAVHILGYTNGDGIGVNGAEYYFNDFLDSYGGKTYLTYQANAAGGMFGGLPLVIYDDGYGGDAGVVLTLDVELQTAVENMWKTLGLDKGAIVIADSATGEIIVSASFPTYNPTNIAAYLDSTDGELINRCARGFTPGSVFKIITAAAALETHVNYLYTTYDCTGEFCYANIAHGNVSMSDAFAQSCNGYFYHLIGMIGVDKLRDTAVKFGIGETNFIDMFYGGGGKLNMRVPRNAAIGQGGLLCTPYEITRVICTVMNGGYFTDLHLFKGMYGVTHFDYTHGESVIGRYTASVLKRMMRTVVTDGIGQAANIIGAGGKTASAQSGQFDADGNEIIHSWFAGYYENYAVTVLCENAKDITAAEVFAAVITEVKQ